MPLIKGFRAIDIKSAFILNSIEASLVILIAIYMKGRLDRYVDKDGDEITRESSIGSIVLTFIVTFLSSLAAYTLMYYLFGFGYGMLAPEK